MGFAHLFVLIISYITVPNCQSWGTVYALSLTQLHKLLLLHKYDIRTPLTQETINKHGFTSILMYKAEINQLTAVQ